MSSKETYEHRTLKLYQSNRKKEALRMIASIYIKKKLYRLVGVTTITTIHNILFYFIPFYFILCYFTLFILETAYQINEAVTLTC